MSGIRPNSFLLIFLAVGLLLIQGCSDGPPSVHDVAPDFKLELFNGGDFKLTDQKGKPVVINFFASWCVSCGKETPVIEKISQEYGQKRVFFLGVAVDDTEKKRSNSCGKSALPSPQAWTGQGL